MSAFGVLDEQPLLPVAGAAGLCFIVIMWRHPRALVGVTLIAILFIRTIAHFVGSGPIDAVDDILVVALAIRAVQEAFSGDRRHFRPIPGQWFFFVFVIAGLVSGILHGESANVLIAGAFLAVKALIFGFSVAQFDWDAKTLKSGVKLATIVAVVLVISGVLNAIAPSSWASIFSVNGGVISRYGLPSISGLFIHPFDFAFAMGMIALAGIAYARFFDISTAGKALVAACSISTVASLRRKDVIGLLIAAAVLLTQGRRWGSILMASLLVPIIAIIGYGAISAEVAAFTESYLSFGSTEARTVLTLGAFDISQQYFPFGAGFGRFGSRTAAINYSPEYLALGFPSVYGLGPGDKGAFLTDTAWPAILGETGVIGTIGFILGLLAIFRAFLVASKDKSNLWFAWLGTTGVAWLTLTLVQSTGAAVFSSPPMFPFLFGIAGIVASISSQSEFKARSKARPAGVPSSRGDGDDKA